MSDSSKPESGDRFKSKRFTQEDSETTVNHWDVTEHLKRHFEKVKDQRLKENRRRKIKSREGA